MTEADEIKLVKIVNSHTKEMNELKELVQDLLARIDDLEFEFENRKT